MIIATAKTIEAVLNRFFFELFSRKKLARLQALSDSHRYSARGGRAASGQGRLRATEAARVSSTFRVGYVKGRAIAIAPSTLRTGSVHVLSSL